MHNALQGFLVNQDRACLDKDINIIPTENLALSLIDLDRLVFFPFTHGVPPF